MRRVRPPFHLVLIGLTLTLLAVSLPATHAHAFCGFYVSGADAQMFADATQVVMMRDDTTTVLSMRNTYKGPPKDFAMVVPVPQVLQKEQVKTLEDTLFDKIDTLSAPRLVEYFEQDPCSLGMYGGGGFGMAGSGRGGGGVMMQMAREREESVKIEAQFEVDEYEIVILSATESNSLERWLTQNGYTIPKGAAPLLAPYIAQGMYFFVAKVNASKVTFGEDGRVELSPLRFHYESKDFSLPVRLGLINAKGAQDLIVHILAKERFEVANYPNVTMPTNLIVSKETKDQFASFYTTLFDEVAREQPGAVVTEYAWDSSSCDPCPGPTLSPKDLQTLGRDVLQKEGEQEARRGGMWGGFNPGGMVLTRLHARYTAEQMTEDLVFSKAEPLSGGRGTPIGAKVAEDGIMGEQRGVPSHMNMFQGRYIMLNPFDGEIGCDEPRRGIWTGGPNGGAQNGDIGTAKDTAFVPRDAVDLSELVVSKEIAQIPSLSSGTKRTKPSRLPETSAPVDMKTEVVVPSETSDPKAKGCSTTPGPAPRTPWAIVVLALVSSLGLRRRTSRSRVQ